MAGSRSCYRNRNLALAGRVDSLTDISLVSGAVPAVAWLLGLSGAAYLLARRGRRWPLTVLVAAAAAVLLTALAEWLLVDVFSVFPEELPAEVLLWWAASLAGVGLAVATFLRFAACRPASRRRRVLAPVAMLGVLLLAVVQINLYFSINPTLGDLLGTTVAGIPTLESKYTRAADAASASAVTPAEVPGHLAADKAVAGQWRPPADLPAHGLLRQAAVPGTVSGFVARNAYIYLPPAYLVPGHPPLPVLVLFPGQPGAPSDWLTGGQLASTLDSYAAAHSGLAPVTVVVDPLGSQDANTLCMDSTIARADTYLSVDVPQWISTNLDVQPGADRWAVGGFSFGATCALQLAARHPDVFPNVIAFAAEREPALAKDRSKTIQEAFGGNAEAFDSRTPLVILASTRFVHSSAYFSAGADDTAFVADMSELSAAARGAGFRVETSTVPGIGHSWAVPVRKMDEALGFLAPGLGLTR